MSELLNQNQSSIFASLHSIIDTNSVQLVNSLINDKHYMSIRERVSAHEDGEGNYDYSQVSNIGMVYLYVHNREKKRKDKTKEDYLRTLVAFLQHVAAIGRNDIRELSASTWRNFRRSWRALCQVQYAVKESGYYHSFLTWCYDESYLKKNVARGLRSVKKIKEEIPERDIEESDLKMAIEFYRDNPKVKSILLTLATSGMRLKEVAMPRWGDLYLDRRRKKYYLVTRTKRDKVRHVHIKDYAFDALVEYRKRVGLSTELDNKDDSPFYPNRSGKRYSLSSLSTYLSKQMAAAGLTTIHGNRVTPHFMRHYFAQTAYANGAPLDWISETVDHSSTKITKDNYLSRQMKKERDVSDFVNIDVPS